MKQRFGDSGVRSEFQEFLKSTPAFPMAAASRALFSQVRNDLNPSFWRVFRKLALVQTIAGAVTLSFCPQLGVGPLIGGHGLMVLFMPLGRTACAAFCGSFLLGVSLLVAAWVLKPEEIRQARKWQLGHVLLLVSLSFSALMLLGGSGDALSLLAWAAAGFAAGWGALASAGRLRSNLSMRAAT